MPDLRGDQAAGLRRLLAGESLRIVTFAAAGVGVGRSHLIANIAAALARQGRSVLVVDENPAPDNLGDLFGICSGHDLIDVIHGRQRLDTVVFEIEPGLRVLPAARAVSALGSLDRRQHDHLLAALSSLEAAPDVILVDTAHDHPLGYSPFALASPETVIVLSASSAAITGAYALMKRISRQYGRRQFRVLVNKVRSDDEAERVFGNLARVAAQHGVASLGFAGGIPFDSAVMQAAHSLQPVVAAFPEAPAALACRGVASDLMYWPLDDGGAGLEQFMRHLLNLSQRITAKAIHSG